MHFEKNENVISHVIQKVISNHLEMHPQVSLRGIAAREDGIGREYLRRLAAGEIPDNKIDRDKVLLTLMTLSKKRTISEIAAFYGEPLSSWLTKMFPHYISTQNHVADQELESMLMRNDNDCVSFLMANCDSGVSIDQAEKALGIAGSKSLINLEKAGYLIKDGHVYRGKIKAFIYTSLDVARRTAQVLLNLYKTEHIGRKRNYIMSITGSLNQEGIEKKQELYRKFHQDIRQIYDNPNYKGEIHTFSVACMDSFNMLEEAQDEIH